MRRSILFFCVITFGYALPAQQSSQARLATTRVDAVQIRPVPPEINRRYAALTAKIQPSARSWMQQRALQESKKSTVDVTALKADAKSHFQGPNLNLQNGDLEAIAFIVLTEAAKASEDDLRQIMAETKAINNSKQALRDTLSEVGREVAASDKSRPSAPCNTPNCRSLSARVAQIEAQAPASSRVRRVQVRPNLSFADLSTLQNDIQSRLDSLNEMSELDMIRMQSLMSQRQNVLTTVANLMKSESDTTAAIIHNIK
jgi:hypothetical protein